MISDYLSNVESDFLSFIKDLPQSSTGRNIEIFQKESVDFKGNSYCISVDGEDFRFFESELSQKWWVEISSNNFNKKPLIPCTKKIIMMLVVNNYQKEFC
jgi:hypothetical protein